MSKGSWQRPYNRALYNSNPFWDKEKRDDDSQSATENEVEGRTGDSSQEPVHEEAEPVLLQGGDDGVPRDVSTP